MEEKCVEQRYPVGVQSFAEIRNGNYVYVDKTTYIYKMLRAGKYYFLSRPRRFGKSLLLSTIEAYFQGRRDLFKGLALDSLANDWESHEILHWDLNSGDFSSEEALHKYLNHVLKRWEQKYNITDIAEQPGQRFGDVIRFAYERSGKKVVILIDEYDKPMLSAIENERLSDRFRDIMKSVFGNLKSQDQYIQFAMLTGVSRFSKVSIFSDLNNLRDISFEPMFSGICGVNNTELETFFRDGIACLADSTGETYETTLTELKRRYDGYHFAKNLEDIYNPYSLVNVFSALNLSNYWIESGTPTYVTKLLKNYNEPLQEIDGYRIDTTRLATEGILSKELIPTLYQSGYLTIKDYDKSFDEYVLGYPNAEVTEGFIKFLQPYYLGAQINSSEFSIRRFVSDLRQGNPIGFMTRINSMLTGVPHLGGEDSHEHTFRNALYVIFMMLGFYTRAEEHTSDGRIDMTVETMDYVYIFEFKVDKTADEALRQIHEKKYWKKFEASNRRIFLIGANFKSSEKSLNDFKIEQLS